LSVQLLPDITEKIGSCHPMGISGGSFFIDQTIDWYIANFDTKKVNIGRQTSLSLVVF
jgi:hypothetical protein